MSYALDSSKRKFHRILDSISNNSNARHALFSDGNASTTSLQEGSPASKRTRLSITKRNVSGGSGHSILATRESSNNTTQSHENDEMPLRTYCPADRLEFLRRLESFNRSITDWSSKPDRINEVAWAKSGWHLTDKETVTCVSCNKRVVINYKEEEPEISEDDTRGYIEQEQWRQDAREKLAEKYSAMITSEHFFSCLWKQRPCDESIYRIPMFNVTASILALRKRYESLLHIAEKLPNSVNFPEGLEIEPIYEKFMKLAYTHKADLPTTKLAPRNEILSDHDLFRVAFGMAIFGWASGTEDVAECQTCWRHLGLWMWRSSVNKDGSIKEPVILKLLPAVEHRSYCPWTNEETQNVGLSSSEAGQPVFRCGWEGLVRVLENASVQRGGVKSPTITNTTPAISSVTAPATTATAEPETASANTSADTAATATAEAEAVPEATTTDGVGEGEREMTKEEKENDRWARLKKLKKAFSTKRKSGLRPAAGSSSAAP